MGIATNTAPGEVRVCQRTTEAIKGDTVPVVVFGELYMDVAWYVEYATKGQRCDVTPHFKGALEGINDFRFREVGGEI